MSGSVSPAAPLGSRGPGCCLLAGADRARDPGLETAGHRIRHL